MDAKIAQTYLYRVLYRVLHQLFTEFFTEFFTKFFTEFFTEFFTKFFTEFFTNSQEMAAMWSTQTSEVVTKVRQRTKGSVSIRLQDVDALFVSIAAGSIEGAEILDFAYEGTVRSECTSAISVLAMQTEEFAILFGAQSPLRHVPPNRQLVEVCETNEAKKILTSIENALSTTLSETAQRTVWQKSVLTRVACYLALCRPADGMECLAFVLGGLVHADNRQIDDLKTTIEDGGIDVMFFAEAIRGVVACVVN